MLIILYINYNLIPLKLQLDSLNIGVRIADPLATIVSIETKKIYIKKKQKRKKRKDLLLSARATHFIWRQRHLFLFRAHVAIPGSGPATRDNAIAIVKQWKYGHFAGCRARFYSSHSLSHARTHARTVRDTRIDSFRAIAIVSFWMLRLSKLLLSTWYRQRGALGETITQHAPKMKGNALSFHRAMTLVSVE